VKTLVDRIGGEHQWGSQRRYGEPGEWREGVAEKSSYWWHE
jgi:hypothetical protein